MPSDDSCCLSSWDDTCVMWAASSCTTCASGAGGASSSSSGGSCLADGANCWNSADPCCEFSYCNNLSGTCMYNPTSSSSGGSSCPNPTGYGGLGCDPTFAAACSQLDCNCCLDGSGIGHCC